MALLGLPLGAVQAGQMAAPQQPPEAFQWGQGGKRMTADDIAIMRELAQEQMATGMDFSPIGHWSQGVARVGQGILGGLQNRKADRAAEANAADNAAAMADLSGNPTMDSVAQALASPYATKGTQQLAKMAYDRLNPKAPAPTELQRNYEWLQGFDPVSAQNFLSTKTTAPPIVQRNPDGTSTIYPAGTIPRTQGLPTRPVGPLTPIEPTTQNTPAPQQGANGMPETLTRQQYMAVVNKMGQQETDQWIARNNVRVSD